MTTEQLSSKEVVRYCRGYGDMERDKYGTWVRLDDFERLQQDNRRYENARVVLTGEIDTLKQKLAYAEDAAAKGDLARQNAAGMDLLIQAQKDKIQELERKLSAALQDKEDARLQAQINAETIKSMQDAQAPLSLPTGHDVWVRCGNVKTQDVRTVMQAIRDLMPLQLPQPPNAPLERPNRHDNAKARIEHCVREIEIICGEFGYDPTEWLMPDLDGLDGNDIPSTGVAVTKSDPFANAPLTGPGSRLEADLVQIRASGEKEGIACPPCQMELGGKSCGDCGYADETNEGRS